MRQLLIQTSDMHTDIIISTDPTDCIPSVYFNPFIMTNVQMYYPAAGVLTNYWIMSTRC